MLKVRDVLDHLRVEDRFLQWPPDVFAVVMTLLQKSGAYTRAVSNWWPPTTDKNAQEWARRMREIGSAWREAVITGNAIPTDISIWWKQVSNSSSSSVPAGASCTPQATRRAHARQLLRA